MTTMRHMLDVPEHMGFDRMLRLGDGDDWAVYAGEPWMVGPIGTPMLVRGTKSQVMRQVRHWVANPASFDSTLFTWRQAHTRARQAKRYEAMVA